jgi:hypothetical protein
MPKTQVLERHVHPKFPRLRIELRSDSRFLQAVTRLDDKLRQWSTKTDVLPTAFRLAEDWYRREVKASKLAARQHPVDTIAQDPTMQELYEMYRRSLESDQKQAYADQKWEPISAFWRARRLSTVTALTFREFYAWRRRHFRKREDSDQLSNSTLHKDKILVRQLFKAAIEAELMDRMPLIPKSGKIDANPRPWLDAEEWRTLTATSLARLQEARRNHERNHSKGSARLLKQRQDIDDLIHFLYASMFRVNEVQKNPCGGLRFKDCRVERNADGDKMLICKLRRGKTGARDVVATRDAAEIYEARFKANPDPNAYIFPERKKDAFRNLLEAAGLRKNEEGFFRNLKSMRPTSISTRMLENPDLNPLIISRNAGVGLGVIDAYYTKRLTAEMQKNELSKVKPRWKDSSAAARTAQRQLDAERGDNDDIYGTTPDEDDVANAEDEVSTNSRATLRVVPRRES